MHPSRGPFLLAVLLVAAAGPLSADGEIPPPAGLPAATIGVELDSSLAGDAAKLMRVTGLSAGYAGWVFIGKGSGEPVLTYVSLVGVLAGGVGLVQGIMRALEAATIARGLETAPGPGGTLKVDPRTALAFERDLGALESGARVSARSALRAGCVVPVLLSGVAIFGLTAGGEAGEQLAGVALGGALAIGGPSMLSYWSSRGRLDRYESLKTRWNDSVHKGRTTKDE
jgi:hypothetical protein